MAITPKKLATNAQKLGLSFDDYQEIRKGRILALANINAMMCTKTGELSTPSASFAQRNGSVDESTIRQHYSLMSHMIGVGQDHMHNRSEDERLVLKQTGPHFDERAKTLSLQGDIMRQMYLTQPEPPVMRETLQTRAMKQTYKKAIARNMVGGVELLKQGRRNGPQ